jgi:trans-aconitate methyltransferase
MLEDKLLHPHHSTQTAPEIAGKTILRRKHSRYGCGPGYQTLQAKERVGQNGLVVDIDTSAEVIEVAREKAQRLEVEVD